MKFGLSEATPGYHVLTCRGGLSWDERETLIATVNQYFQGRENPRGLVVDMTDVDFMNSAGVGALFRLAQRFRTSGGKLAFANLSPTFSRLLTTVGMDRMATLGTSIDETLKTLEQAGEPLQAPGHRPSDAEPASDAAAAQ